MNKKAQICVDIDPIIKEKLIKLSKENNKSLARYVVDASLEENIIADEDVNALHQKYCYLSKQINSIFSKVDLQIIKENNWDTTKITWRPQK